MKKVITVSGTSLRGIDNEVSEVLKDYSDKYFNVELTHSSHYDNSAQCGIYTVMFVIKEKTWLQRLLS